MKISPSELAVNKDPANISIQIINELDSYVPNWYYELEPTINKLHDHDPTLRYEAIHKLKATKTRSFVKQLQPFKFDSAAIGRNAAQNKLRPIESYYRAKFFYFENKMKKFPNYAGYRLGFAIICLRYCQMWVQDTKLQDYFLRDALRQLNRLIRTVEPKKCYFYYRGQVLKTMHQTTLAIADFKIVLEKDPKHWGAILKLIDLYINNKQPHKSFNLLQTHQDSIPEALKEYLLRLNTN